METKIKFWYGTWGEGKKEYLTKDKALKKVANLLETRDISDIEITFKEEV